MAQWHSGFGCDPSTAKNQTKPSTFSIVKVTEAAQVNGTSTDLEQERSRFKLGHPSPTGFVILGKLHALEFSSAFSAPSSPLPSPGACLGTHLLAAAGPGGPEGAPISRALGLALQEHPQLCLQLLADLLEGLHLGHVSDQAAPEVLTGSMVRIWAWSWHCSQA